MLLADSELTFARRMKIISNNVSSRETIVIGLGDLCVSREPYHILSCIGLGSCIALCAYDPQAKLGGMAHIVLPNSRSVNGRIHGKYADSAVPMLLEDMFKQGAIPYRLVIKIAGGANMLSIPGQKMNLNIGERNIEAIKEALSKWNMTISGSDLGGTCGRSIKFYIDSGRVVVQTIGKQSIEL